MTYDERLELEEYLVILKKNCERTLRSIDMMKAALEKMKCELPEQAQKENAKEAFLKNY